MLADGTRLLRLGLLASTITIAAAFPVEVAWADDDEEDEDEDEGDDEGDDEEDEEEEEEDDEDQPPVTAGGLFTKKTYPISELQRPMTITRKMTEIRVGLDVDVSAKTAFEKWGLGFNARHGLEDNFELQFDLRSDLNQFSRFRVGAAIETSISYDLVNLRLGAVVPVTKEVPEGATEATTTTLLDFELGFPFRYAPKPNVGIIALDTFMTINTKGKPDLTPSVGIVVQPIPVLAIKLNGKVIIVDFDTEGTFEIPVSANVQFSPNNLLDIGGEFTFPNLKPEEGKFTDNRMLLLYGQIRI